MCDLATLIDMALVSDRVTTPRIRNVPDLTSQHAGFSPPLAMVPAGRSKSSQISLYVKKH